MDVMDSNAIREFYLRELSALRDFRPAAPASGVCDLVMGLAMNLGKADVEIFVNSLRLSGYDGEIALFVTHVDPELQAYSRRMSVTLVRSTNLLHSSWNAALMRFLHCYDYLMSQLAAGRIYKTVLMSDVTDVAFQLDPFSLAVPDRLTVFSEGVAIGECPTNSLWIKYAFGLETLARLNDAPVYCSGTTMGPVADVLDYLLKMMLGATNAHPQSLHFSGIDQGIHNYLIHEGWLPNCRKSENGELVLTMYYHLKREEFFYTDKDGRVCDVGGRIWPVMHQYNRDRRLKAHVRRAFADPSPCEQAARPRVNHPPQSALAAH